MAHASAAVGCVVLSALQRRVARLFFERPGSEGFALAGGAALIARGAINRETEDLDFFVDSRRGPLVPTALAALEDATRMAGLELDVVQVVPTFARVRILDPHSGEDLMVDLAVDAIDQSPEGSELGPMLRLDELAANKLLALYGRMEPRDFEDTWRLLERYQLRDLMQWATEKDAGFDPIMFAETLAVLPRLPNDEFTIGPVELNAMRSFWDSVHRALTANVDLPVPERPASPTVRRPPGQGLEL
jgi:hypothetical protein